MLDNSEHGAALKLCVERERRDEGGAKERMTTGRTRVKKTRERRMQKNLAAEKFRIRGPVGEGSSTRAPKARI